jgi:hypothetical protein
MNVFDILDDRGIAQIKRDKLKAKLLEEANLSEHIWDSLSGKDYFVSHNDQDVILYSTFPKLMRDLYHFESKIGQKDLCKVVNNQIKSLNWYVGHIAYDLMKSLIPEKKEKTEAEEPEIENLKIKAKKEQVKQNQEVLKMVMESNLLSGGIQNQHQNLFST